MSTQHTHLARLRTRWSAIGAAVAITLGAGGFGLAQAAVSTGEKPITVTIEAERILDTRDNLGLAGKFAHATPRDLQVTGEVAVAPSGMKTVVPADAVGVLVNVTVVSPSHAGFLALRPAGATGAPDTSTVNFFPGTVEPNAATVDLGPGGKIQIWVQTASASGNADVLVDIVGYTIDHNHNDIYYTKEQVNALTSDIIPSGTTVTGNAGFGSAATAVGEVHQISVSMPSIAPSPITTVVFASSDATCTGSAAAPTAPPGKVCLYDYGVSNLTKAAGTALHQGDRAFYIGGTSLAAGTVSLFLTWAYTAP